MTILKVGIATIALGITFSSNQAFANVPFLDEDTKPTTFEVGLTGGFIRLSPDLRFYGTQKNSAAPVLTDNSILKINPRYRPAAGIDIVYGSTYKFNGIYFEAENNKGRANDGIVGTTLSPPAWGDFFSSGVSSRLKSRYRFATVSVSNSFTLNCFTLTPSFGLSYLFLRHNHSTFYDGVSGPGISSQINLNSKFNGFGPTFAANFGYEFCGGISAIAALQYSPLIGDIRGNYSAIRSAGVAGVNTNVSLGYKTQSTLVNHIQSELGVGYFVPMNKCYSGYVSLVYRFVKIVGARETALFVDNVNSSALNNLLTNTTLHGPLLRVGLKFKM